MNQIRKHKLFYVIIVWAIMLLVNTSCNHTEAYFSFKELKDAVWDKYDTLYFNVDSSNIDLGINYDVTIELINNSEYAYQNIWLSLEDNFNDSITSKIDKEYVLSDPMGKWDGVGFSPFFQISLNYKKNIKFKHKKNYTIQIVHAMKDEPLLGIEKIGICIKPSQ